MHYVCIYPRHPPQQVTGRCYGRHSNLILEYDGKLLHFNMHILP